MTGEPEHEVRTVVEGSETHRALERDGWRRFFTYVADADGMVLIEMRSPVPKPPPDEARADA